MHAAFNHLMSAADQGQVDLVGGDGVSARIHAGIMQAHRPRRLHPRQ